MCKNIFFKFHQQALEITLVKYAFGNLYNILMLMQKTKQKNIFTCCGIFLGRHLDISDTV